MKAFGGQAGWWAKFHKLLCMGTKCVTKVWNLWTHIYYRYFRYLWIITWFSYYSFIDWRHFPQDANIMWSSREKLDDVGIFIMYHLENHFVPPKNHKGNWCHDIFCACWVYPNCQISNNDNFHCITWISVPLMEIEDGKYWKVATKQLLVLVLVLIRNNGGGASNEPLIKSPQALCSQGTGVPQPLHF